MGRGGTGFYQAYILPRLIALAMRTPELNRYRARVCGAATGRVLELGIGPGFNLPFYGPAVREVVGVDPAMALLDMARHRDAAFPVELLEGVAEALPIESESIDTVVCTWTLCSVPDPGRALADVRRVLRPGGRLLFCEHGLAPDAAVRAWQDRLTPVWRQIAGGCHLNRPIETLVRDSGFQVETLEAAYARGPKLLTYFYTGSARAM